jgi:hypothetical protein
MDDNELRAKLAELTAERDALHGKYDVSCDFVRMMIEDAGEAIGTDPSLRTASCVTVLADAYRNLRAELDAARAHEAKAVEAAWREGFETYINTPFTQDELWKVSDARAALEATDAK